MLVQRLLLVVFFSLALANFTCLASLAGPDKKMSAKSGAFDGRKKQATDLFFGGKYKEARDICVRLKEEIADNKESKDYARILINLGIVNLELGRPRRASHSFDQAKAILTTIGVRDALDYADVLTGLAESRYRLGHVKDALALYKEAYAIYGKRFSRFSGDLIPVLEGIGGSYLRDGMPTEALPYFRHIAQIDFLMLGPTSPRVGKSFSNLADVFYRLEECGGARPFFAQSIWIFRKNSMDALLSRYDSSEFRQRYSKAEIQKYRKRIRDVVMGVEDPPEFRKLSYEILKDKEFDESCRLCENKRPIDFDNWQLRREHHSDTGFIELDPTVEPKGIIVCLHGLGLNHQSYREFAQKVRKYGYTVIAVDVRGFGSLSYEKGFDKVDLEAGLDDLQALMSMFAYSNKKLPLFLLGESMGGALALQFTARYPDFVSGLISSVPSGRRFRSKRTKIMVGIKLLDDPSKPFAIGKSVVEQASSSKATRDKWLSDPANRLKLSADELLDFESFMKHNERYAREISKTPVIIFQGFRDHLVRPNGTYALYQALATRDKDLMFVGNKEHLVFEEGTASDKVVSMLVAWLNNHGIDRAVSRQSNQ